MQLDGIRAIEHRLWRNPEVGACMQLDTYYLLLLEIQFTGSLLMWGLQPAGDCINYIYYHRQPLVLNKLFL